MIILDLEFKVISPKLLDKLFTTQSPDLCAPFQTRMAANLSKY